MLAGTVICIRPDRSMRRLAIGSKVATCLRPRIGGGAIIAREHGIAITDADFVSLTGDFIDARLRFNEGNCDPSGRFYAGTMAYDRTVGAAPMDCASMPKVVAPNRTLARCIPSRPA